LKTITIKFGEFSYILSFVNFQVNMHINEIVLEISGYPSKKRLTSWAGTCDSPPFPFPSTEQSVLRIRYSIVYALKAKLKGYI